jgi:hypothetical protein
VIAKWQFVMLRLGEQANRFIATVSPGPELSRVLVCFDHVAGGIVTGTNAWKKRGWADLFVTSGFGSLSQLAMSSALRVFMRGMFGFAEIIVVVTSVCMLAAIGLILLPCAALLEWTAFRPYRARHIGN